MIQEIAPAKINLYLHITGKNANNYHILDSLVVFADIYDVVTAEPANTISLHIEGNSKNLPTDDNNIIVKTAQLIQKEYSINQGVAISLTKNIPIGAGIGGGSADAAATIRILKNLWQIDDQKLDEIALSLGADVPVCLKSKTTYMSGIGEIIETNVKLPELYILLVNNNNSLLTKDVFAKYHADFSFSTNRIKSFDTNNNLIDFLQKTRNDLQEPATTIMPEISDIIGELRADKHCLLARMSGSGATCFGLFAEERYASNAANKVRQRHHDWWIKYGKILD